MKHKDLLGNPELDDFNVTTRIVRAPKKHPPLLIRVVTTKIFDPVKPPTNRIINLRKRENKLWLMKNIFWAVLNGHDVGISHVKDDGLYEDEDIYCGVPKSWEDHGNESEK